MFDAAFVINLPHRTDRLDAFNKYMSEQLWPFPMPKIVPGVYGERLTPPAGWQWSKGAYGCTISHRQVITEVVRHGYPTAIIFEDDAIPTDNLAIKAQNFMDKVPEDWDVLMLGGKHILPPTPVNELVVQCNCCWASHAYVLKPRIAVHIMHAMHKMPFPNDVIISGYSKLRKIYAPTEFLFGQTGGRSDIEERDVPVTRWFNNESDSAV